MNSYLVKYENNLLRVINITKHKELTKNDMYVMLHDLDNHKNTKVFASESKIIIKCASLATSVTLDNAEEIMKSKYRYMFKKTMNKINEGIKQIQIEKNKEKIVKTQKALKITTFVAPIVLIATMSTYKTNGKEVEAASIMEPIPIEDLQEYEAAISDEQIIKTAVNTSVNNAPIPLSSKPSVDTLVASNTTIKEYDAGKNVDYKEKKYSVTVPVEDLSNTEETEKVKEYYDAINASATRWGISPNWLSGIMTTESRGKETNLMQIIHRAFDGQVMKVYNFEENKWMKVVFTNNPNEFKDVDMTISAEELKNPKTNISAAAIILNFYIHYLDTDNISIITEVYNKGKGNLDTNLKEYCRVSGLSYDQVLSNPEDVDFLKYSYVCGQGGPNYVSDVYQFVPNAEDGIYFYRMKDDQKEKVSLQVNRVLEQDVAKAR